MTLKDELYTIRHLAEGEPPTLPGGMYASAKDGKDKPLTAEPLGPDSKIRLRMFVNDYKEFKEKWGVRWSLIHWCWQWVVACVPSKDGEYTITEFWDDNSIPGLWAREINAPDRPVWLIDRLKVDMYTLKLRIQEAEEPGVYDIMGDFRIGASDWTDLRHPAGGVKPEVLLRSVPVVPGMYIPRWVFAKA
ncbi:macrocypin 2b [Macrolepiota fuliginosa MF-IS2]|uniref:Macrocypin 2b n=1 Tax=Macrolepiota fuliginosa MF-IS2 TaxID=1400762 RepID=A0A9P6BY47_9AGAR|nr:macrocypin 2b [Macrolepiota fuliginosa MF-IS2]